MLAQSAAVWAMLVAGSLGIALLNLGDELPEAGWSASTQTPNFLDLWMKRGAHAREIAFFYFPRSSAARGDSPSLHDRAGHARGSSDQRKAWEPVGHGGRCRGRPARWATRVRSSHRHGCCRRRAALPTLLRARRACRPGRRARFGGNDHGDGGSPRGRIPGVRAARAAGIGLGSRRLSPPTTRWSKAPRASGAGAGGSGGGGGRSPRGRSTPPGSTCAGPRRAPSGRRARRGR